MGSSIRLETKTHLSQVILDSPARAGIPTEWEDRPAPLRAFAIIGLENEIVEDMQNPSHR